MGGRQVYTAVLLVGTDSPPSPHRGRRAPRRLAARDREFAAHTMSALRRAVLMLAALGAPTLGVGHNVTLSNSPAEGSASARLRRQAAQMIGGRPPHEVEVELCTIVDVFGKLTEVKDNEDCRAGCARGTGGCPEEWYPGSADECSAECGAIFEPFVSCPRPRQGCGCMA